MMRQFNKRGKYRRVRSQPVFSPTRVKTLSLWEMGSQVIALFTPVGQKTRAGPSTTGSRYPLEGVAAFLHVPAWGRSLVRIG